MAEIRTETVWIALGEDIPSLERAREFVKDPACGATHLFTGTTRNHHNGRKVIALYYDCYEAMALREMQKLAGEMISGYSVYRVALFHKTGDAPVGEVSLVTAISSPHRQAAMDATTDLINRVKESVPVWKRETFETGEKLWKEEQIILPPEDSVAADERK